MFISLSFSLDGKVPKDQVFIKMPAFRSQRYLLAIQGMEKHSKSLQYALLCIATHMSFAHTSGFETQAHFY